MKRCVLPFFWTTNSYVSGGKASIHNMDIRFKISFKSQNLKKKFPLPFIWLIFFFFYFLILIAHTYRLHPYKIFGVWTYQSMSKSQSSASLFGKKECVTIRNMAKYFVENWKDSCMSVFFKVTRFGISL